MKKLISFVLPVYNEEKTIKKLYSVLSDTWEKAAEKYEVEFLFINDGSQDDSLKLLREIASKDNRVKVINFSRNFGHQIAITAGLDLAEGDAVIIMDADLQDPPTVALELISKWEEGFQVVYAKRKQRKDSSFKKSTAYVFYRLLNSLTEIDIPKDTGDFRLMDKQVVEELRKYRETNRFMRGLVAGIGFRQTAVEFKRDERYAGETKYPLRKMLKFALDGITSLSTVPLRLITQMGFVFSAVSFVGIAYALFVRIFIPAITVPGTTFAIISILFVGGVQMIMLGIIGEYIGRIYTETQRRPLYIVESIYSQGQSDK